MSEINEETPTTWMEAGDVAANPADDYDVCPDCRQLVDRLLAELDRLQDHYSPDEVNRIREVNKNAQRDLVEVAESLKAERDAAQRERDEARRLLGLDVQEVLTEVDAMRGRLTRRIEELSEESERRRVEAFGKERTEAERVAALATLQQVREWAEQRRHDGPPTDDLATVLLDGAAHQLFRILDGGVSNV